jgi:hypothetical protein
MQGAGDESFDKFPQARHQPVDAPPVALSMINQDFPHVIPGRLHCRDGHGCRTCYNCGPKILKLFGHVPFDSTRQTPYVACPL